MTISARSSRKYDVIVVGVGGVGSAAVDTLAQKGVDVLGIERFDIPNEMGSSHGDTRVIRKPIYEHPDYVPLVEIALEKYQNLQDERDEQLLYHTGTIDAGVPGSNMVEGALKACRDHDIEYELLDGADLSTRYPGFQLPEHFQAVYQSDGGFVVPERTIVAHVNRAHKHGAEIHGRERVLDWKSTINGIELRTDRAQYNAEHLVVTSGAWAAKQVPSLDGLTVPERIVMGWFQPKTPEHFVKDTFPAFNMEGEQGSYYGTPVHSLPGFKIGHYAYNPSTPVDPDKLDREPSRQDEVLLRRAVDQYFPEGAGPTMRLKSCMITNSPDGHFIVDSHPDYPEVVIGAGFSGRGFKFTPVIGEILADLTVEGETKHDISLFSMDRFD